LFRNAELYRIVKQYARPLWERRANDVTDDCATPH
jgi:hypothetical protein